MTASIFDYIAAVTVTKNSAVMASADDEQTFSAYMLSRWLSMHSPEFAAIANETTNRYSSVFETKKDQLDFFISVFPRSRFSKIAYIKKVKESKVKEDVTIPLMAKSAELSIREIEELRNLVDHLKVVDKDIVCQQT